MSSTETKTITHVYAVLTVSLLMSFVPMVGAAALAMILFIGVWIAAYVLRRKTSHDSLLADHMTYIIRTIWITGLFALITTSIASAYILNVYDPSALLGCTGNVSTTDMAALKAAVQPCVDAFVSVNMPYFVKGTIIAGGPLVVYMAYRLAKGLSRATKGHRIGDVKSWF